MCLTSTPKAAATPPPPEYLHNSLLDSGTMSYATGRNNLKIDLNTPASAGVNLPTQTMANTQPVPGRSQALTGINVPIGTPGMVIPTVGGAMSGSYAGAVVPGTSGK